MKRKVILSAGGTGGHLFPAQSLAGELSGWEILFVAGGLGCNRYFNRNYFNFKEIECATFSFYNPLQVARGCLKIFKGVRQSQEILTHFNPDLIVGFGSFFTLPMLIAALLEKVPFILHEQNAIPGKVNRLFSSFAHKTTITFPKTREFLKGKALERSVEVLFPLRKKAAFTKEESLKYFGLNHLLPTVLVFGGSQGAEPLNALFLQAVASLSRVQVLHFTGKEEWTIKAQERYRELNIRAYVRSFESCMDRAMHVADFAITRAGAATIAELIEYELPALVIPYRFATENHQENNGLHFVSLVKGGKMYKENALEPILLAKIITEQLPFLSEMKMNIAKYKQQRQHVPKLAELIEDLYG